MYCILDLKELKHLCIIKIVLQSATIIVILVLVILCRLVLNSMFNVMSQPHTLGTKYLVQSAPHNRRQVGSMQKYFQMMSIDCRRLIIDNFGEIFSVNIIVQGERMYFVKLKAGRLPLSRNFDTTKKL